MLNPFQALLLGLLQGITELFPISSLGHSVILPSLFNWKIDQNDPNFLTFIVATHLATAIVLLGYFFKDWKLIILGIFRSLKIREIRQDDTYARIGWLLVVSSVPVGVLGIVLEKQFSVLFAVPLFAGIFLMGNGLLLYGAELLIRWKPTQEVHNYERIAQLTWSDGIKIGLMQCLALLPGFSRTGATLAGGLLVGLSHEDSARYAFLLATPIIFAAALLKIPELLLSGVAYSITPFAIGTISAGLAAYISIRFLVRYFQTNTLNPFAFYCLIIGAITILVSAIR